MSFGWRWYRTESAGNGEKHVRLTGLPAILEKSGYKTLLSPRPTYRVFSAFTAYIMLFIVN